MNDINNEFAAGPVFARAMLSVSAGRHATLVALALGLSLGCGGDTTTSSSGAPGATNIGDTGGITGGAGGSSAGEVGGTAGSGGDTAGSLPTSAGETTGADGATTDAGESTGDAGWVPPPPVTVPPLPPPPDYSGYPVDDMGRPIVSQGPLVNWVVVSTPDPISAREGCADLVANCHDPELRSIDACLMSAPHCVTAEPWTEPSPCCADACFTAYAALRVQGTDPFTAYLRILYDGPICMPGVDAMLGGAP